VSKRKILSTVLEDIFFNGSEPIGPDSEVQGIREDLNGHQIRRDDYGDRESNCGWGICDIRRPSGLRVRLPMRLRELDALSGRHGDGSPQEPCPHGSEWPLPDGGLAPCHGPSHGNSGQPIGDGDPHVEWDSPADRPELCPVC
jgi:hypothetical protein